MLDALLSSYSPLAGRYDELLAATGAPRTHWQAFLNALARREGSEVSDTLSMIEREVRENGITYNVYADPRGADRPWQVDPLPLVLSAGEWQGIESGIAQRAELLNRLLADLYGPQAMLREGLLPPEIVFGHSGYIAPAQGIKPPGDVHLFQYAADLARSPDGRWWVVADRTQAPSGAGYALENRWVVARVFPQMFRELHVQHHAAFFAAMRDALLHWAPRGDGAPLMVLLTPGPYNETYFEHALLARYLGFTLVEGHDLLVRDGAVWLKTVEGLRRVHAVLRRQDDDWCDPLELRSESALGVPGLLDCARRGGVMLANAFGAGVLESGGLMAFLPALARRLLGAELAMPSVATWWLGDSLAFDDAWSQLDHVMIKALDRASNDPAIFGADLDADQRAAWKARIAAHPQRWVAQEWVHVAQAPVLEQVDASVRGRPQLSPRTVGLRVFAVATPEGWRVMPGGLTRVASDADARVIAMQRGGRSKDTWVLSEAPTNASLALTSRTVTADDLAAPRSVLSSRAAENLFWFGRYGERCEATIRLLRVAIGGLLDPDAPSPGSAPWPELVFAQRLGVIDDVQSPAGDLLYAATHRDCALGQRLKQLQTVAFSVRERMSNDHWRTLNRVAGDPIFRRDASLPLALAWLDRAVAAMTTLSGFVFDGMTRGVDWRFLSMGRRIERLATMSAAVQVALNEGRDHGLDWLVDFSDSTITYRSRYLVAPEWLPVLDLLVRDTANTRSLAYQVKGLCDDIARFEATGGAFGGRSLHQAREALDALTPQALHPDNAQLRALVAQLHDGAYALSDALTLKFFSHAAAQALR